jgi:translation initiation factor 2 alpha subunit (eIF-2alpha)
MYFYNNKVPVVGDILCAKIVSLDVLGVKLKFIEYNDQEGYILYNNLKKRKKNDINQTYKPNREIYVEYIGMFEEMMSFTDKNQDLEDTQNFEKKFKLYTKIVSLINSFLIVNKEIDRDDFFSKVLYNPINDLVVEEDAENDDKKDPFEIVKIYDRIVKEDIIEFKLEESIKTKFYDYIKKHRVDTKFKGSLKYESISVNSSGLVEIKSFYSDIIRYAKENNISIEIKLDSSPNYLLIFNEERYNHVLEEKINSINLYIKNKEIKFSNKLILTSVVEV